MKTTALDAHRATLRTYLFGPLNLETRRRFGYKPLSRHSRLLDANTLHRIQQETESCAVVEYYGHPSGRRLIAFPLPGVSLETVRAAAKNGATVSGHVSCGNYVFPIA
jgi:hypothetical protein